jgi:hypothetical protein
MSPGRSASGVGSSRSFNDHNPSPYVVHSVERLKQIRADEQFELPLPHRLPHRRQIDF